MWTFYKKTNVDDIWWKLSLRRQMWTICLRELSMRRQKWTITDENFLEEGKCGGNLMKTFYEKTISYENFLWECKCGGNWYLQESVIWRDGSELTTFNPDFLWENTCGGYLSLDEFCEDLFGEQDGGTYSFPCWVYRSVRREDICWTSWHRWAPGSIWQRYITHWKQVYVRCI